MTYHVRLDGIPVCMRFPHVSRTCEHAEILPAARMAQTVRIAFPLGVAIHLGECPNRRIPSSSNEEGKPLDTPTGEG